MSKTLSLKKPVEAESTYRPEEGACDPLPAAIPPNVVPIYTAEQLRAMLAKLEPEVPLDPTMNLSIDLLPPHVVADKSALPSVEERTSAPAPQLGPALHGAHGLNGFRLVAPQIDLAQNINPATGAPFVQVGPRPQGGMISPPPSRRFDGR